jgi:putative Holliday junction resolvase
MRYLGIDYGTKRVGLALSDDDGKMGFPHLVVHNTPALLEELSVFVADEGIGGIVFGDSKNLDGEDNKIQEELKAFAEALGKNAGVPVYFEPEYYTTKQAKDAQKLAGKESDRADAIAAAIILTTYLERHGNH